MRILDIREKTIPIASPIANAYIDFSKMTCSLVAVITDVTRDGRRVVGYGFDSNGRYAQGALIRERFRPRLLEADPASLADDQRDNLDPHKIWARMMSNEKPGGHGERSVAVGTLDMACGMPWRRSKVSRFFSCWRTDTAQEQWIHASLCTQQGVTITPAKTLTP